MEEGRERIEVLGLEMANLSRKERIKLTGLTLLYIFATLKGLNVVR